MVHKDMVYRAGEELRGLIAAAVKKAAARGLLPGAELPDFAVEIPADTSRGDFASNAALAGAKAFEMQPRRLAEVIVSCLDFGGGSFSRAEAAGPGFLNFFLRESWFPAAVSAILELGDSYGRTNYGRGKKVMVEFVSANPTGPMHMGNARGGALGDCLASAMDAAGYDVTREFYVNDAGSQIEKFGLSLEARYLQILRGEDAVPFPEDGYHGDDIRDLAREYAGRFGDKLLAADSERRRRELVGFGLPRNIGRLEEDLLAYRVSFERWFHESELHRNGTVNLVLSRLEERGLTYKKDGAVWYRATEFGGEKDEVLIRQNGHATYFAADIAYHYNKFETRGFAKAVNLWGADHHGHVARLKGAMDAIGLSGDNLDIVLFQFVRLIKEGEPYKMSKRTGRSVTLGDLLEEIPVDAARFFFISRESGSVIDFDLDLAVEQSSKNPVYYVQYAHARICSILKKLEAEGIAPRTCAREELALLREPEEIGLIRHLARYPGEIISAAERYDPSLLAGYLTRTAALFHKFYTEHRVRMEDEKLMQARISLCRAAQTVLANLLGLLKISAPESM